MDRFSSYTKPNLGTVLVPHHYNIVCPGIGGSGWFGKSYLSFLVYVESNLTCAPTKCQLSQGTQGRLHRQVI